MRGYYSTSVVLFCNYFYIVAILHFCYIYYKYLRLYEVYVLTVSFLSVLMGILSTIRVQVSTIKMSKTKIT